MSKKNAEVKVAKANEDTNIFEFGRKSLLKEIEKQTKLVQKLEKKIQTNDLTLDELKKKMQESKEYLESLNNLKQKTGLNEQK
jgi:cell division FtsZ-interacting protein ZapD